MTLEISGHTTIHSTRSYVDGRRRKQTRVDDTRFKILIGIKMIPLTRP